MEVAASVLSFRLGDVFGDDPLDQWVFSMASLHNDLLFFGDVAGQWTGSKDPVQLTQYFYAMRVALALTYEGTSLLFNVAPKAIQSDVDALLANVPSIAADLADLTAARVAVGGLLDYRPSAPGPGHTLRLLTFHYPNPSEPTAQAVWDTLKARADEQGGTVVTEGSPGQVRHAFVDYVFARTAERLAGMAFDAFAQKVSRLLDAMTNVSGRTVTYYVDEVKGAKVTQAPYVP